MPCTTLLVGKNASYDGSTLMARNEDSSPGRFTAKKFIVVNPEDQPKHYRSVISSVEIDLPDDPMRYTAMPNALPDEGIWGEAGINDCQVAMSETETITSNPRVLAADPLVKSGIGEEDMLTIVLPYIHSAREGVLRLGSLLEQYGTYEMNGIGFQDINEIWWLESVGGHHWIAKRVPDDSYVVMPNQQGIDVLDLKDAYGEGRDCLCCPDLLSFIEENHLDLACRRVPLSECTDFNTRLAFGSHSDSDHVYNTPRAWYMLQYLNGEHAEWTPESDTLPWSMVPPRRITVEDVKYVLSSHYQGTIFDPYDKHGDQSMKGKYRPIGINRNNFLAVTQLRPYREAAVCGIEWIAESSNAFNAIVPFFANVRRTPEYFANTTARVTTENFYWANRLIAVIADAHYGDCIPVIERYQNKLAAEGMRLIQACEKAIDLNASASDIQAHLEACNDSIAEMARKETDELLNQLLFIASCKMKNAFSRADG